MTNQIHVGLLSFHVNEGSVILVHSGEVEFVNFMSHKAIGAYMVLGAAAVSIVSPSGCILAQIPVRPAYAPQDPFSAEQNVRRIMEDVEVFYRTFRSKLLGAKAYIAYGNPQSGTTVPEQARIMTELFRKMGLEPKLYAYESPPPIGRAASGTFLVVRSPHGGQPAHVFLEDGRIE